MDLFETLKQLKAIESDPTFRENSRRAVLASAQLEPSSPRHILARIFGAAGSLVLAGALIFIITGGLSKTRLAPQFSSIDPVALHAEAQAIDLQINLLNVSYTENPESTPTAAGISLKQKMIVSSSTMQSMASSTPTSTISIDAALQALSQ
ncbi:MAG: hypothetical protein WCF77_00685 [Minisyncoccia bacterium]